MTEATVTPDTIEVPLGDLEVIRSALNAAYHHATVLDLAEQYRRLTQRPQTSKLTRGLETALTIVVDYLEAASGTDE